VSRGGTLAFLPDGGGAEPAGGVLTSWYTVHGVWVYVLSGATRSNWKGRLDGHIVPWFAYQFKFGIPRWATEVDLDNKAYNAPFASSAGFNVPPEGTFSLEEDPIVTPGWNRVSLGSNAVYLINVAGDQLPDAVSAVNHFPTTIKWVAPSVPPSSFRDEPHPLPKSSLSGVGRLIRKIRRA